MKYKILLIIIILVFSSHSLILAFTQMPKEGDTIALFCFAQFKDEGIQFNNPLIPILESKLIEKGFKIYTSSVIPLESKQILQYTIVENRELKGKETKTGKLYFELGSDGSAKIESENGFAAYSKLEVSSIEWMLDKEKAWKLITTKKCQYVLFVTGISEDITKSLNNKSQLSGQKSVSSSIIMSLVDVNKKTTVKSFYNEKPSMDSSGMRAAINGWHVLIDNAINQWFENKK